MPYLTTREKSKATTKRWFSRLLRHPARKQSGSTLCIFGLNRRYTNRIIIIIIQTQHIFTYLLSPDPHGYSNHRTLQWAQPVLHAS